MIAFCYFLVMMVVTNPPLNDDSYEDEDRVMMMMTLTLKMMEGGLAQRSGSMQSSLGGSLTCPQQRYLY